MKKLGKVMSKARFTTDATASQLNYDPVNRSIAVGRQGASGGYIGRVCESSKGRNILDAPVWFNSGFPNVIGVFGMRGTGKSFNLGVFAECLAGMPQVSVGKFLSPAVVILDVQNQFWTLSTPPDEKLDSKHLEMLARWKLSPAAVPNVRCWTPAGVNSFVPDAREYRISPDQLSPADWLALLDQGRYSPIGQALLELLRRSPDSVPSKLAEVAAGVLSSSFQQGTIDALRWRLESMAETDIIGSPGVDIGEFLAPGQISVVLLRSLPESLRALTAATLVRLLGARMTDYHQRRKMAKRGKMEPPKENLPGQIWVMMDEAHVIAPREGKTPANEPLVDYVKRGRDSGLSLIFATQQPSAVDDKLMSQVDMTMTHALGFDADVQAAVARMPTRKPADYKYEGELLSTPGDLIHSLNPGEAILADSANPRPFVMQVRPRLSVHGGDTPD